MFERDLPGENKSGLSFQQASEKLPLETCETISNSWGYNLSDTLYKSKKDLVNMLVKAAGLGSNLLLNIGPMPNGKIQPEFQERLAGLGDWLKIYGESIYNTRGGYVKPQAWGSITQNDQKIYIHILDGKTTTLRLDNLPAKKIRKAYLLRDNSKVNYTFKKSTLEIKTALNASEPDQVVVLEIKN